MSSQHEKAITVVSIIFIIYLNTVHIAQAQVTPAQCRQRCANQLAFYQRFVRSQAFLQNLYNACTRNCPVETTTTSTTTTTPKPTTTTTTTTTTITTTPTTTTPTTTTMPTTTMTTTTTTTTPIPRKSGCGIQSSDYYKIMSRYRVVGGLNTGECEYPWMVAVSAETRLCGGSILDKRHVLTAAHCLRDRQTKILSQPWQVLVRVGSSTITRTQVYQVKRISIHPRYGDAYENYDVAVLTLSRDLYYSACVTPICLPEVSEDPKISDYCMVAGWGLQDLSSSISVNPNMQKVEVSIIDNSICRVYYDSLYGPGHISDLKMCAGDYDKGGIDSCEGDSGGPLMCLVQGRFVIHGIVSSGYSCGLAKYPGIYSRVAHPQNLDFITKIMETN